MSVIERAIMTVNVSASDSAQRHCDDDEPDVRLLCDAHQAHHHHMSQLIIFVSVNYCLYHLPSFT